MLRFFDACLALLRGIILTIITALTVYFGLIMIGAFLAAAFGIGG